MKGETASNYRRRDDGVLELLRPARRNGEAMRGAEIAIAVIALAAGAAAAVSRNVTLAAIVLTVGFSLLVLRLVRDALATRALRRRLQIRPVLPPSDDRVGLRVIRFQDHTPVPARVPGTAVRLPGTAASPQE